MPRTRATSQPTLKPQVPKQNRAIMVMNRMLRRTIGLIDAKINRLDERITTAHVSAEDHQSTSTGGTTTSTLGSGNRQPSTSTLPINPEMTTQQIFYAVPNVAERPRYPGKRGTHPVTFVEDLTAYLNKRPAVGDNIETIIECLEGEARDWARIYKERWTGFKDFKRDFMSTYWGEAEQNALRRKIVHNTWDKTKHPTMLGHFISLAGQAKMLHYPIPEKQLVDDIIGHFPKHVQYSWAVNPSSTILDATEFLRKVDNINKHDVYERSSEPRKNSGAASARETHEGAGSLGGRRPRHWRASTEWKRPQGATSKTKSKNTQEVNVIETNNEQSSENLN